MQAHVLWFLLCITTLLMKFGQSKLDYRSNVLSELRRKTPSQCPGRPLKIGAFNIQIFGDTKYKRKDVVDVLLKIMVRYDLLLVMEIRDSNGDSFPKLIKDLNALNSKVGFEFVISERMGDGASKEQYAFVYRSNIFTAVSEFTYKDPQNVYQRPPFAVLFQTDCAVVENFVLAGIHTSPSEAAEEIAHLNDVYEDVKAHFKSENIVIMGDYNGDCTYVKNSDWDKMKFRIDPKFKWLILDDIDTTVAGSSCAYDRIVASGSDLIKYTLPNASVFYFDKEFNLNKELVKDVSDHYPVEFEIAYDKSKHGIQQYKSIEYVGSINQDRIADIEKALSTNTKNNFAINHADETFIILVK